MYRQFSVTAVQVRGIYPNVDFERATTVLGKVATVSGAQCLRSGGHYFKFFCEVAVELRYGDQSLLYEGSLRNFRKVSEVLDLEDSWSVEACPQDHSPNSLNELRFRFSPLMTPVDSAPKSLL